MRLYLRRLSSWASRSGIPTETPRPATQLPFLGVVCLNHPQVTMRFGNTFLSFDLFIYWDSGVQLKIKITIMYFSFQ